MAWFGEQTDANGQKVAVERKQGNMLNEMLNNYVEVSEGSDTNPDRSPVPRIQPPTSPHE